MNDPEDSLLPGAEEAPESGPGTARGGRRRAEKRPRRLGGCLVALLLVGALGGVAWVGLTAGVDWVKQQFAEAEDFSGPGSGSVVIEVSPGDTATDIGRTLHDAGVVASVEAFTDAARGRSEEAARIQPGSYEMRKEMKAADALGVLINPGNAMVTRITVPEGLRAVDVAALLAEKTDFSKKQFDKALTRADELGLPDYAGGKAEGYLFPATYDFGPKDQPVDMLRAMVDRWRQSAEQNDIEQAAQRLGYTPHELMTVASLVEAEGRGDDMPKIARVIYNRLENPGTAGTIGRLEIDATVNYALGRKLGVAISTAEIDSVADNPYNTRRQTGLPPGPIEAPGDAAIAAALAPAKGDWYYYVTVDLRTGETKFATTYDEFLQYKAEFQTYCQTSDAC
ncbi:endolytic transglycosylase MltG [Nocardioides daejeonensis]|uniref:endolytic transglycosylase MltG n=1 Tax=Nocardioides daejeonensis TaxID=1046556 RepID=UPI000D74912F|nr:endolytic transglycosylase MltG [Nocardioides daejeonensis]